MPTNEQLRARHLVAHNYKHGCGRKGKYSPAYKTWMRIRARCNNPKSDSYKYYGAKGIGICKRWDCFSNFLADMGERPSREHSIDRIDSSKGYSPENCRWVDAKTQSRNRQCNHFIEINGVSKTISEWAEIYGMPPKVCMDRLRRNWALIDVFTKPMRPPRCPRAHLAAKGAA